MAKGGQLQRRQNAIPAQAVGGSKDVTGLFTTKGGTTAHHGGVDVLIADRRAVEDAAAILPGPFKPEVGHHRGH